MHGIHLHHFSAVLIITLEALVVEQHIVVVVGEVKFVSNPLSCFKRIKTENDMKTT